MSVCLFVSQHTWLPSWYLLFLFFFLHSSSLSDCSCSSCDNIVEENCIALKCSRCQSKANNIPSWPSPSTSGHLLNIPKIDQLPNIIDEKQQSTCWQLFNLTICLLLCYWPLWCFISPPCLPVSYRVLPSNWFLVVYCLQFRCLKIIILMWMNNWWSRKEFVGPFWP